MSVIDKDGFRENVGIILVNKHQELFLAKRVGPLDAWQFPQGGIDANETPTDAFYRELFEETGISSSDVRLLQMTKEWLHYRLPSKYLRAANADSGITCIGQKQIWFLAQFISSDDCICFDKAGKPEFETFAWVDYWYPLKKVISFKKKVYHHALKTFEPVVFGTHHND
jgi:putative (di)nucleoside polyphosphate hydrolase